MLDPEALLAARFPEKRLAWSERDAILYALGAGCRADESAFVRSPGLKTLPTFATIACYVKMFDPAAIGVDYAGLVHSAQTVEIAAPMPAAGEAVLSKRIAGVWDRGVERGAVIAVETVIRDAGTGAVYATLVNEMLARHDGGFGGTPPPRPSEDCLAADVGVRVMPTTSEQGLLFRLSGDWNPLHSDPATATAAGFDAPILHGLCTYAICCRALLIQHRLEPASIGRFGARFAAPVYPGETITVTSERRGMTIGFAAHVGARKVVRAGLCQLTS